MEEKLAWHEIEKFYDQQWVQLVEYEWEDGRPYPSSGVVRIHAPTRKEFNRLVLQSSAVDAARVFVGQSMLAKGVVFSPNIVKMTPCES